jgi:hypothetical protein
VAVELAQPAWARVAHLAPFAPEADTAVDITLDGELLLEDVVYGDSTDYRFALDSGEYDLAVLLADGTDPVITSTLVVTESEYYSVVANGDGVNQPLALTVIQDNTQLPAQGNFTLSLGHFAPFASGDAFADVRLQDGTALLEDVPYGAAQFYGSLLAGEYDLNVTAPGGEPVLIDVAPVALLQDQIVTVFATGEGENAPLGAFAWIAGGPGFFLDTYAKVRVAHFAPFASDAAGDTLAALSSGTAVTVTIDGAPALTNFIFGDSTAYLDVPTGERELGIVVDGTTVTSATVNLETGTHNTVVAIGGVNGHAVEMMALADDVSAPAEGHGRIRLGHLAPFAVDMGDTLADIRTDAGDLIVGPVAYRDVAEYMELPAGEYNLQVTTPGGADVVIDLAPFTLNEGDILDVFAVGDSINQRLSVAAITGSGDTIFLPHEGTANLRVAHLAPFAATGTEVTVLLNGTAVLTDFAYLDSTNYIPVKFTEGEQAHLVQVEVGGSFVISAVVDLGFDQYQTIVATGGANGFDVAPVVLWDDNTAPDAGKAKVRIGHLAPFTNTLAGTTADVRLDDGTVILPGVQFGDVMTDYLQLDAGEYDLQIVAAGTDTVLIDLAPVTFNDGDILYVFATGDGTNQPTGAFAYPTGAVGFPLPLEEPVDTEFYIFIPLITKAAP